MLAQEQGPGVHISLVGQTSSSDADKVMTSEVHMDKEPLQDLKVVEGVEGAEIYTTTVGRRSLGHALG